MLFGPLIPSAVDAMATTANQETYMAAVSITNAIQDTLVPATGTWLFALSVPFTLHRRDGGGGLAAGIAWRRVSGTDAGD